MLIGLTGQIGAGKSTAAKILAQFGAAIVDADMIGRQVVEHSPTLLRKLVKRFGKGILSPTGRLNRKALAKIAFASPRSTRALNALVHPYLLRELYRQVKLHSKRRKAVIIDAALLLNWRLDREVDPTIVITAPLAIRIKRMSARGLSRAEVIARQKSQPTVAELRSRADFVISNSGTSAELRQKLTKLWRILQKSDC
ncbi:MAG: dephospho-CoA kinase [candidate division Zixibacteria bacterium]|nr:dephospho-CoA kinase [candidate division Zixibacteria bacterium]